MAEQQPQQPAEFKHKRNGRRWLKKFMHIGRSAESLAMVDWSQFTRIEQKDLISAEVQIVPIDDSSCYVWYVVAYRNRCGFDINAFERYIGAEVEQKTFYDYRLQLWDLIDFEVESEE